MLCLGLPWALVSVFFRFEQNKRSFHTKTPNLKKTIAQLDNCSGLCTQMSAPFPPIPAHVAPMSAHFHGSKLAKSCQVKVSAHVMFVRAESETSNKVPRGLRSDQTEDLGMLVISFGEVHDGKSSTLCDKRNCVDFEVGPCLVRQRQPRRNNHRCIGSVQPWASSRCVDGQRGTSRLVVGWLLSLMNAKHLTPAQPSMPQWSQPDVAAYSFEFQFPMIWVK